MAGFTRRDYVAVSDAMRRALNAAKDRHGSTGPEVHAARSALASVALELSEHFARDNPKFDARLFFSACGLLPL